MGHSRALIFTAIFMAMCFYAAHAQDDQQAQAQKQDAKGLDMVSDTVSSVFGKANALLSGNLEVTMSKEKVDTSGQYTRNAIGQKVPTSTAVKSAGSLHNDEPL
jgi:hypothetical protein